jgi:hypothetical protein
MDFYHLQPFIFNMIMFVNYAMFGQEDALALKFICFSAYISTFLFFSMLTKTGLLKIFPHKVPRFLIHVLSVVMSLIASAILSPFLIMAFFSVYSVVFNVYTALLPILYR